MGTFKVDGKLISNCTGARLTTTNGTTEIWTGINEAGSAWGIYNVGTAHYILKQTENSTNFYGNADTATKLATARTISLTGSVTGSGSFDGSGNLSISTTTNHSHSYLPLSGGNLTGHIYLTKAVSDSSTANTSQIVFGTSSNNHLALSSNTHALILNPSTGSTTNQIILSLDSVSTFPKGVNYASSAGNCDTVDGWHATGFLQKHGWWSSGGSYSVNNLTSGIAFTYTNHGAPGSWGHTIAFTSGGNDAYVFQLHATGTNRLFMRNKSSDYGQKDWVEFYTTSGGNLYGNVIVNTYNNALTIGSLNEGWCHFQSSANRPFYFNRTTFVDGALGIYGMNSQGVGSSFPSSPERGQIFFKI